VTTRPHLVYQTPEGDASFELPDSRAWRINIGSSPDAECQIPGDDIAAQHAVIFARGGKVFLEPSAETTVAIEGRPITHPTRLPPGSSFTLGDVQLRFLDPAAEATNENTQTRAPSHSPGATPYGEATVLSVGGQGPRDPDAAAHIALTGERVDIGRSVEGDGRIDDPQVSRLHAELRLAGRAWTLRDLGSTNGTFVNGERLSRARELNPGDHVAFGSLLYQFTGDALQRAEDENGVRVDVVELTKTVRHRDTGEPLNLIDGISMSVEPGEFVVMLGSSGCGKSTFMDAINGRRRGTAGQVLFSGRDLYREFPSLKRAIGYVPQEVIYHKPLPVEDILLHAAHLRLPTDTTPAEIEKRISEVLSIVGLAERRKTPAAALSGGQQKRVSIAIELLSRPKILFLDEVTSGLDMKTEREMMALFRQLADDGITIFCITHHLENLAYAHHIAYFFRGKLAFFGPEPDFLEHFGIGHAPEIYDREEGASPSQWAEGYRRSPLGQKLLEDRLKEIPAESRIAKPVDKDTGAELSRLSAERTGVQTATLTKRYIKLIVADRATLAVTLALAPVIGIVMAFAAETWPETLGSQALNTAFMAGATVFFFGLFTASREIVKDLPVYLHERMVGLEIVPYLASRILPLSVIGLIQVLVFIVILRSFTDLQYVGNAFQLTALFFATSLAGSMFGLLLSALVDRVDTAVSLMIFAVVPQLLFAGNYGEMEQPQKAVAATLVTSYWTYDASEELLAMPGFERPEPEADETEPQTEEPDAQGQATPTPTPAAQPAPPSSPPAVPVQVPGTGGGDWLLQILIVLAQAGVLLIATFLLVLRRDGPGAIRRFFSGAGKLVQARNRDDKLVSVKQWIAGAGQGIRKAR